MSYIIIYNPNSPDAELDTDYKGFIQTYASAEDASEVADENMDRNDFRDYQIYEEVQRYSA